MSVRVLIVAPSLAITGGHSVQADVLLKHFADEPAVTAALLPIDVLPGPLRRIKYVRTLANELIYAATLLARVPRYDVLHVFAAGYYSFLLAPVPAMLAGRLFGKRIVLNYHDGRAEGHLSAWPSARRLMPLAHRIVTPSQYLVDVFARHGLAARPIFNVVDASRFRFRERSPLRPVFLHNRGLDPVYNPQCTLRAFALVQHRYPEASLIVAHEGPLRGELEKLAAALQLRNISFIGVVPKIDAPALYDRADVFLSSPNFDNMPLSVLEAFAAGLPVISSRVGGVPYIVDDGRTGLLFPPGDHEAMAGCALRLLDDPELARRLATAAHAECDQYTWPRVGPQWLALYRELA